MFQDAKELLYNFVLFLYFCTFLGSGPKPDRRKRAAASRDDSNQTGFCDKVKKMQRFFGLSPDGKLSEETLTVMKKPRCGLSDVEPHEGAVRWRKRTISYRIAGENLPFPASRTHKAIRRALKLWSSVSLIKFRRRAAKEADVGIAFVTDHGDGFPFSGKGGALAHAFLPGLGIGGDVHFDSEEEWTLNSTGISLPVVAAHEFGHALGLSHSPDPGSIMYPAYNFAPSLELSFDDVKRIQHLYGEPPPKTPDKCDPDLSFDAVTELQQEVVFFKDRCVFSKDFVETRITLISSLWSDSVPSHLDAVYENVEKNFILFFKVQQLMLQEGFPRNISDLGFPSRIKSVDAALHFRRDRYTVFFTGRECWRSVTFSHFPSFSLIWLFVSSLCLNLIIDSSFPAGFVNFFKGNKQYKYDFGQNRVVSVSRANDLMGCEMGKGNKHIS
uniref:Collagenase 3 n=1 Tax=Xiphophorus maculatus TaxID=8083 RepID=A0A3B5QJ48_XIPMA